MNAKQIHIYLLRCYRLGVLSCIRMSLTKILSPQNEVTVHVPGFKKKLFLRKRGSDQDAFDQVFVEQGYAQPFLEGFSPRVIIDAGAYVGYSTVYFANKYPDCQIIAVEPERSNFDLLKKNTSGYRNVQCIRAALWSTKTKLYMKSLTGREWSFRVQQNQSSDEGFSEIVPTVTIPEIMEKFGLNVIDILKIDIEGAEKELFSKNYETWIGKCKIIVIELHERFTPGCSKAFYSALSGLSFGQYIRRENVFIDLRDNQGTAP